MVVTFGGREKGGYDCDGVFEVSDLVLFLGLGVAARGFAIFTYFCFMCFQYLYLPYNKKVKQWLSHLMASF